MNKVKLIIIYNHRYDKNMELLESIYKGRFSNICHLVPFYDGDKANVIPVYENSFYFQGYVAQGFNHFYEEDNDYYLFIADDLILNPNINELNYRNYFGLSDNACFLPRLIQLHKQPLNRFWPRISEAYNYRVDQAGVEAVKEIPDHDEASRIFLKHGLKTETLVFSQIWNWRTLSKRFYDVDNALRNLKWLILFMKSNFGRKRYSLSYPLVGSYADIFIVASNTIERFSHYCGVFAATRLHVELAVASSLVLAAERIVTEGELTMRGKALWPDGWMRLDGEAKRANGDYMELEKFGYKLRELLDRFPEDYLYLHPIKLSKWDAKNLTICDEF